MTPETPMTDAEFLAELNRTEAQFHAELDEQARDVLARYDVECSWPIMALKCIPIAACLWGIWMLVFA